MVMVEVLAPALDKKYDFQLDENVSVNILTEEIAEMICHKEQSSLTGKKAQFMLCWLDKGKILSSDSRLSDFGVYTGSRLMLV